VTASRRARQGLVAIPLGRESTRGDPWDQHELAFIRPCNSLEKQLQESGLFPGGLVKARVEASSAATRTAATAMEEGGRRTGWRRSGQRHARGRGRAASRDMEGGERHPSLGKRRQAAEKKPTSASQGHISWWMGSGMRVGCLPRTREWRVPWRKIGWRIIGRRRGR
jgi:hypothetical protein